MSPIIILLAVGIVAGLMSVGFLGETITLWVQQLGVGTADIDTPITDASIDWEITAVPQEGFIRNQLTACFFHSSNVDNGLLAGSKIICKLSGMGDLKGKIIAEGSVILEEDYIASTTIRIPINTIASGADFLVPVEIGDVQIIAQGPGHVMSIPASIDLEKTADPEDIDTQTDVLYSYTLTNTGQTSVVCGNVDDDELGTVIDGPIVLFPDETAEFETTVPIDATVTNTATVTCIEQVGGTPLDASDSATVTLTVPP